MNSIFISCARRSSAELSRPVMQPVRRPAVCARVRPWPSCASKVLISSALPSVCESSVTLPSVIVPSTSMRRSLICAARFLSAGEILGKPAKKASRKDVRVSLSQKPLLIVAHYTLGSGTGAAPIDTPYPKENSLTDSRLGFAASGASVLDCAHGYQEENQEEVDVFEEKRQQEVEAGAEKADEETDTPEKIGEARSRSETSYSEKSKEEAFDKDENDEPAGRWRAQQKDSHKQAGARSIWLSARFITLGRGIRRFAGLVKHRKRRFGKCR